MEDCKHQRVTVNRPTDYTDDILKTPNLMHYEVEHIPMYRKCDKCGRRDPLPLPGTDKNDMVKYAPLPDDSKSLYSESHLKNLESMPRLDLDMDKGEYPSIPSSAFETVAPLPDTTDNE